VWAQLSLSVPAEGFEPGWYHFSVLYSVPVPVLHAAYSEGSGAEGRTSAEILCGYMSPRVRFYGIGTAGDIGSDIPCGQAFTGSYEACLHLAIPTAIASFRMGVLSAVYRDFEHFSLTVNYSWEALRVDLTNVSLRKVKVTVIDDGPWLANTGNESLIGYPPISPATKNSGWWNT
jgi:hypothetical protein